MKIKIRTVFYIITFLLITEKITAALLFPGSLRCEYLTNPMGIDVTEPRLSWVIKSTVRGQRQTAYQILAANSSAALEADRGGLLDTGKVDSSQSIHVVYKGAALKPGQRVYWKVRVWGKEGRVSEYSGPAWWEMGLLKPDNWKAKWITHTRPPVLEEKQLYEDNPAPLFRKEFRISRQILRARVYVSGLGYYELYVNGKRAGDHRLDPAWTAYSKRVFYSIYDITALLNKGPNALGIFVGNGWYNPLPLRMWGRKNIRKFLTVGQERAILQLHIDYTDGTSRIIVTDETWKTGDSPVQRNSVYLGEHYDARKEQAGWDAPGFDDNTWQPVRIARDPVGKLYAQPIPPIRICRTIKPVKITNPKPGIYIYDMGQNFTGVVKLRVKGPGGSKVTLKYGELLYPDGTLNYMTSVSGQIKKKGRGGPGSPDVAFQADSYILKGKGNEIYMPRFTFHGFRYVEVSGYPGTPGPDAVEGLHLHTDTAQAGSFSCSHSLFNRIQKMTEWTLLNNLLSVQSDCAHREKFGYGGDIVASSEMAMFNFDMSAFYAKTVEDFADAALPEGGITETAPYVGISAGGLGGNSGPIGWGTVHPLLLYQLYQYYGNRRLIDSQYELAEAWLDRITSRAKNYCIEKGIGDHESLVRKPTPLTSTAFYYYNAELLSRLAKIKGLSSESQKYSKLAALIKDAFNKRFLKKGTGIYHTGTQACQAFALFMNLVPPAMRELALLHLVKDITVNRKGHLSTGIFGTKYMLDVLGANGYGSISYMIANQTTFPGWGYMLEKGATTLWEHWAFSDNTFSHCHPMFGSISEWFFKHIAGISPHPEAMGFDRIIIKPSVIKELSWAKAEYNSIRGIVKSEWRKEKDKFILMATVPVNTEAEVYIPARKSSHVKESGKTAGEAEGVEFLKFNQDTAIYKVGSGTYIFEAVD